MNRHHIYTDENLPSSSSSSHLQSSSNSCTPVLGSSSCFAWSTLLGQETPSSLSRGVLQDVPKPWSDNCRPAGPRQTRAPFGTVNRQPSTGNMQHLSNSNVYLSPIPFHNFSSSKPLVPISYQSTCQPSELFAQLPSSVSNPGVLRRSSAIAFPPTAPSSRMGEVRIFSDDESTTTATSASLHIGSIRASTTKEHECRFADCTDKEGNRRRFKRLDHLRRHQNTCHGGHRPFSCWVSTCTTKPFSRRDNLNAHLKKIHGLQLKRQKKRYVAVQDDSEDFYEPYYHGKAGEGSDRRLD